jgi:hypothetical protein
MNRAIMRPLEAWDRDDGSTWVFDAGAVVGGCRIVRNDAPGDEPYVVEFDFSGRRYACPLFAFQPRTQILAPTAVVATELVEHAVAV